MCRNRLHTAVSFGALTIVGALGSACGARSAVAPSGSAEPLAARHFTVSGTVFENTSAGRRPLADAGIDRVITLGGSGYTGTVTSTDSSGHYSIPDVAYQSVVAVFTARFAQPCPAFALVTHDSNVDLDVMQGPLYPAPARGPRLSGVVFYHDADGVRRRYREGASLGFFSAATPDLRRINLVRGATDDAGRFELCGLPLGPAVLDVGYGWDFERVTTELVVRGDASVEIEVPPPPYGTALLGSRSGDAFYRLAFQRRASQRSAPPFNPRSES